METKFVTVIFAYDKNKDSCPWIYGIYNNLEKGIEIQMEMEQNIKYKHLKWSNVILPVI